ncbi:MAG: transcription antitermination factor NusB [Prolixibacteraceae bacterium]|jgi:N utilization substance protein B|nr:transcription antitermination factor NusB [Prolixibacteraceae bacterium]
MISRRIIRIKVMQSLYAFHTSPDQTINQAEKELFHSIKRTYDLYHLLLQLLVEVHKYASERSELRKKKNFPTEEDLNPNTKFINNGLLSSLAQNIALQDYLESKKLSWIDHFNLIKKLHNQLTESEFFSKYMANSDSSISEDRGLVEYFYAEIVAQSDDLYQLLEEQSIYWNDDVEFVISMIIRTLGKFKANSPDFKSLMPLFKDREDEDFTKELIRKSIVNSDEYRSIIKTHLKNWEIDRVAFIDVLIMEMAICEFLNFQSIPTKVSLNEYIDLARYYSTIKSRTFINGILDKILKSLNEDGKVKKAGRGLIEETKSSTKRIK